MLGLFCIIEHVTNLNVRPDGDVSSRRKSLGWLTAVVSESATFKKFYLLKVIHLKRMYYP